MLAITVREGERVWIGDDVFVKAHQTGKNAVRLAISAPREVTILRDKLKLLDRMKRGEPLHAIEADMDLMENQRDSWALKSFDHAIGLLETPSPAERVKALLRAAEYHANVAAAWLDADPSVAQSAMETAAEKLNQAAKLLED